MHLHSTLLLIHVLGACVWFGGHVVLSFTVLPRAKRAQNPQLVLDFERSFEKIGILSLLAQVLTGPMLALRYVPQMGDWFRWQNEIQDHIASKLILLAVMVVLAISMRVRVLPRLAAKDPGAIKSAAKHVHSVTFISFLMVLMGVSIHTGGFSY